MLSVEEVTLLLCAPTAPKYKAAFATAYGAGLRVSEVVVLKVGDIDSERMLLRVERGKGGKDRHAMLSPQLLELLRAWWREGRRRSLLLRHERFGGADITTVTGGTTLIPTFGYRSSVISVNMDKFFGLFLACVK